MNFQNEKVALHLNIVKYKFEDAKGECDRNWLIVKTRLSEENKVFETMDPFLQNTDLQYMIKWFQSLPNPTYNELDFIEPNVAFEFIGEKEGEFHIVIRLSQELNPLWCKEDEYEEQQRKFPKR